MTTQPFNVIKATVSNGGMNKEARILLKRGRKVLDLRSCHTTSFMGRLRHTFEAVLWNGPSLRSGTSVLVEKSEAPLNGLEPPPLVPTTSYGSEDEEIAAHRQRLVEASMFTFEEFQTARRSMA